MGRKIEGKKIGVIPVECTAELQAMEWSGFINLNRHRF